MAEEFDLEDLSNRIQSAIQDGFTQAINEINRNGVLGANTGQTTGGDTGGGDTGGGNGSGVGGQQGAQAATNLPPQNEVIAAATADVVGAEPTAVAAVTKAGEVTKKTLEAFFEDAVELQGTWYVTQYQNLIRDLGPEIRNISAEEFAAGNFSNMFNEGEKAAAQSVRNMADYAKELVMFEGLEPEEISRRRRDIIETFGDTNINLLHQTNAAMEREAIRFSNAMNITADETAELIGVMFAETGEGSEEILTEITNQATTVGRAVGVPIKVMAEGIKEVKLDMDTFTDMTVEGAARMVASLSQLGMSIGTFKNLMQPFRDFDSAATKMGDLSAMFGVQMDAMEMMYLANEDEEQFLHKMREQLLDQGLDVENMSKTRQRALAEQLGMGVKEMKMFMNTGQIVADQAELQAASQAGATLDHADAMETLNNSMIKTTKNLDKMLAIVQNLQGLFSAPAISEYTESVAGIQAAVIDAQVNTVGLSGKIIEIQQMTANVSANAAQIAESLVSDTLPGMENFFDGLLEQVPAGWQAFAELFGISTEDAMGQAADSIEFSIEEQGLMANSWPEIFYKIGKMLADPSVPGGSEQKLFYENSVRSWGETISNALQEAISKIREAADFDELMTDFNSAATGISSAVTDINTSTDAINSPTLEVIGGSGNIEVVTNDIAAKLAEAVQTSIESLEREPTEVNVSIDIEAIKRDLVETIKEGFEEAEYNFDLAIDREKIATVIARSKTSTGRAFQMRS